MLKNRKCYPSRAYSLKFDPLLIVNIFCYSHILVQLKDIQKNFHGISKSAPFFLIRSWKKELKTLSNQSHFLTFLHWWNISMFQLHNKGLDFKYYFGWQQNIFFSWCSTSTWLWNISICLTLYLFVQKYKFAEDLEKIPFLELNFEFDHWTGKNAINAEQNLPFLLFRKPNVEETGLQHSSTVKQGKQKRQHIFRWTAALHRKIFF